LRVRCAREPSRFAGAIELPAKLSSILARTKNNPAVMCRVIAVARDGEGYFRARTEVSKHRVSRHRHSIAGRDRFVGNRGFPIIYFIPNFFFLRGWGPARAQRPVKEPA
jgi:hypothetical protein